MVALMDNIQITDKESYATAETVLTVAGKFRKAVDGFLGPHIKRAYDMWQGLNKDKKDFIAPVDTAEATLRVKMTKFQLKEEAIENQRKADEAAALAASNKVEEDKRLDAAEALEKAGMPELAAAVVAQEPEKTVVPVFKAQPVGKSSGLRDNWIAVVEDRMALIKAIAEGKVVENPEDRIIFFNETLLNKWAREQKDKLSLPGVVAKNDKKLVNRGK